jgi:hypothetical protein
MKVKNRRLSAFFKSFSNNIELLTKGLFKRYCISLFPKCDAKCPNESSTNSMVTYVYAHSSKRGQVMTRGLASLIQMV